MADEKAPGKDEYIRPKIWQIIFIGLVAIIFTSVWLLGYQYLNAIIWKNGFVEANRWTLPAGVMVFSFLIGLCGIYLRAPNVIRGGISESMTGNEAESDYKTFPGTLLSSYFSLFSGASIGPEGSLGFLIMEISSFVREKLRIAKEGALGFDMAALASAYNGIIGNPLFTAIFATEFNVGKKDAMTFVTWNLLAGVIGFFFYSLLGLNSFMSILALPQITEITAFYVIVAVILGVLGSFVAILMGLAMQGVGNVMDAIFKERFMIRVLSAGIIISAVCYFFPELMFSGDSEIFAIIANPAEFGIFFLLILAVLKVLLLALSFKSGFLGGPIFPTLFACTMIGLALSLAFPEIPVGLFVMCIEVAVITLALGAPLTAILLVAIVGMTNLNILPLLVLSSVVAFITGVGLREMREKKSARPE
jgi:H+/Cl- antiporter ClcA